MIFAVYWVMGNMAGNAFAPTDQDMYIHIVNMPDEFAEFLAAGGENSPFAQFNITSITPDQLEQSQYDLQNGDIYLIVIFPKNIDLISPVEEQIIQRQLLSTNSSSSQAFHQFSSVLHIFHDAITQPETLFYFDDEPYDFATEQEITGMILSSLLPILLLTMLFSGCLSITPESIAGEKERGTIASILVSPIDRGQFAMGKIISLSVIALLAGLSSFAGTILALPMLLGDEIGLGGALGSYAVIDYLWLFGIIMSTVLLIVALMSVISAFAKSVKEAASILGPLMIVFMLAGFSTLFGAAGGGAFYMYLIPAYNSAQGIYGIFGFSYAPLHVLISILSNLAIAGALALLLAKMFNSEKVMFKK